MPAHSSILLIEDSPGESELFRLALAEAGAGHSLHAESDVGRAWHFLRHSFEVGTLPSIVLLDLKLRNQHGLDFLKRLRADTLLMHVPVVIFTTSDAPADLAACYAAGANGYVMKPDLFEQLVRCVADLSHFWVHWNRSPYMVETKC
jgi:CheY-like chemotaxis protein